MTSKYSVGALVGAFVLAASLLSCPANALTFSFSFHNYIVDDPAQSLVQGIVSGLQDNTANQQAASVQITSNPAGFGLGEYVGSPDKNSFTVSGGVITDLTFLSFGLANSSPAVTCCTLALGAFISLGVDVTSAGLQNAPNVVNFPIEGDLTFALVSETPLPAALPLFAGGLGALRLLGWRRKRKALAA